MKIAFCFDLCFQPWYLKLHNLNLNQDRIKITITIKKNWGNYLNVRSI